MAAIGSGDRTIGDMLTDTVIKAMEEKEERIDEEIKRLDNMKADDLEEIRRKRLEQMQSQAQRNHTFRMQGHGSYDEIDGAKEFFQTCKDSNRVVCHFYRPSTWRCQILDKHFRTLAQKHLETKFVKLNIEKAMYLAEKLRIYMLPTVLLCKDGKTEHSIIGFDEMGGSDKFETEDLENVLLAWKVIDSPDGPRKNDDSEDDADISD